VRFRPGSYQFARSTPTLGLSGTSCAGTPPMKASALTSAPIQSGKVWVRVGLSIGVIRRAHHRDEDLGWPDLAGSAVGQVDRLTGIVDEHSLAGRMSLADRRRQPAFPGAVQLAPAAVEIAVRLPLTYSSNSSISVTPGRRSS